MSETTKRLPPKTMPSSPEELLAFVAWPDMYEGEYEEEYTKRQALCKTLGERYAKHMAGELNVPTYESKIWVPGMVDRNRK
jgi:hypothetical protein